jgi:hypothetical protein
MNSQTTFLTLGMLLRRRQGNSVMGIPLWLRDQALDQAAEKIPESVVAIYRFW